MAKGKNKKKDIWAIPTGIAFGSVLLIMGIAFLFVCLVGGFKTRYEPLTSFNFSTNVGEGNNAYIGFGEETATDKYYIFYKEALDDENFTVISCFNSKITGTLFEQENQSIYFKDVIKQLRESFAEDDRDFDQEILDNDILIYRAHTITILPEPYDATELDFDFKITSSSQYTESAASFAIYKEKLDKDGEVIRDKKGYPIYEENPYKISNEKQVYAKKPVEILLKQSLLDSDDRSDKDYFVARLYTVLTEKVKEAIKNNNWNEVEVEGEEVEEEQTVIKFDFSAFDEVINPENENDKANLLANYKTLKDTYKRLNEVQRSDYIYKASAEIYELMFSEEEKYLGIIDRSTDSYTQNLVILEDNIALVNNNGEFKLSAATSDSQTSISGAANRQTAEVDCKIDSQIVKAVLDTSLQSGQNVYINSKFNVFLNNFTPTNSNKPYGNTSKKIRYFSSNEDVATVSASGEVVVKKESSFTIYAYCASLFEYEKLLNETTITAFGDLLNSLSGKIVWASKTFDVEPVKAEFMQAQGAVTVGIDDTFTFTLEEDNKDDISLRIYPDSNANLGYDRPYMYPGMLQKLENVTYEKFIYDTTTGVYEKFDKDYFLIEKELVQKDFYNGVNITIRALNEFDLSQEKQLVIVWTLEDNGKTYTDKTIVNIESVVNYTFNKQLAEQSLSIYYESEKDADLWKKYYLGEKATENDKQKLQEHKDLFKLVKDENMVVFGESDYDYIKFFVKEDQTTFLTTQKTYKIKGDYYNEIAGLSFVEEGFNSYKLILKEGILYPIRATSQNEEIVIYPMLVKTEFINGEEVPVYIDSNEARLYYYNDKFYTKYQDGTDTTGEFVCDIYTGEVFKHAAADKTELYQDEFGQKLVLIDGTYHYLYEGDVFKNSANEYFTKGSGEQLYMHEKDGVKYLYKKQEAYTTAQQAMVYINRENAFTYQSYENGAYNIQLEFNNNNTYKNLYFINDNKIEKYTGTVYLFNNTNGPAESGSQVKTNSYAYNINYVYSKTANKAELEENRLFMLFITNEHFGKFVYFDSTQTNAVVVKVLTEDDNVYASQEAAAETSKDLLDKNTTYYIGETANARTPITCLEKSLKYGGTAIESIAGTYAYLIDVNNISDEDLHKNFYLKQGSQTKEVAYAWANNSENPTKFYYEVYDDAKNFGAKWIEAGNYNFNSENNTYDTAADAASANFIVEDGEQGWYLYCEKVETYKASYDKIFYLEAKGEHYYYATDKEEVKTVPTPMSNDIAFKITATGYYKLSVINSEIKATLLASSAENLENLVVKNTGDTYSKVEFITNGDHKYEIDEYKNIYLVDTGANELPVNNANATGNNYVYKNTPTVPETFTIGEFIPVNTTAYYLREIIKSAEENASFVKIKTSDADRTTVYYNEYGNRISYIKTEVNGKEVNYFAQKADGVIYATQSVFGNVYEEYLDVVYKDVVRDKFYNNAGQDVYHDSNTAMYMEYSGLYAIIENKPITPEAELLADPAGEAAGAEGEDPEGEEENEDDGGENGGDGAGEDGEQTPPQEPKTTYIKDSSNSYYEGTTYYVEDETATEGYVEAKGLIKVTVSGHYKIGYDSANGTFTIIKTATPIEEPGEEPAEPAPAAEPAGPATKTELLNAYVYYAVVVDTENNVKKVEQNYFVKAGEYLTRDVNGLGTVYLTKVNNESQKPLKEYNNEGQYYFKDAYKEQVYIHAKLIKEVYLQDITDKSQYILVENEHYDYNQNGRYYGTTFYSAFEVTTTGFFYDSSYADPETNYTVLQTGVVNYNETIGTGNNVSGETITINTEAGEKVYTDKSCEDRFATETFTEGQTYYILNTKTEDNTTDYIEIKYLTPGFYSMFSLKKSVSGNYVLLPYAYTDENGETGYEYDFSKLHYLTEGTYEYNGFEFVKVLTNEPAVVEEPVVEPKDVTTLVVGADDVGYYYYLPTKNESGVITSIAQKYQYKEEIDGSNSRIFTRIYTELYMVPEDGYYYLDEDTNKVKPIEFTEGEIEEYDIVELKKGEVYNIYGVFTNFANGAEGYVLTPYINIVDFAVVNYHDNSGGDLFFEDNEGDANDKYLNVAKSSVYNKNLDTNEYSINGIVYNLNAKIYYETLAEKTFETAYYNSYTPNENTLIYDFADRKFYSYANGEKGAEQDITGKRLKTIIVSEFYDVNYDGDMENKQVYLNNGLFYTDAEFNNQFVGQVYMVAFKTTNDYLLPLNFDGVQYLKAGNYKFANGKLTTKEATVDDIVIENSGYYFVKTNGATADDVIDLSAYTVKFYSANAKEVVYKNNNWCYKTKNYYVKEIMQYTDSFGNKLGTTAGLRYEVINKIDTSTINIGYTRDPAGEIEKINNTNETIPNTYVDDTIFIKLNKSSDFTSDYVVEDYTLESLVKNGLLKCTVKNTAGTSLDENSDYVLNYDYTSHFISVKFLKSLNYLVEIKISNDLYSKTDFTTILNATLSVKTGELEEMEIVSITGVKDPATGEDVNVTSVGVAGASETGEVQYYQNSAENIVEENKLTITFNTTPVNFLNGKNVTLTYTVIKNLELENETILNPKNVIEFVDENGYEKITYKVVDNKIELNYNLKEVSYDYTVNLTFSYLTNIGSMSRGSNFKIEKYNSELYKVNAGSDSEEDKINEDVYFNTPYFILDDMPLNVYLKGVDVSNQTFEVDKIEVFELANPERVEREIDNSYNAQDPDKLRAKIVAYDKNGAEVEFKTDGSQKDASQVIAQYKLVIDKTTDHMFTGEFMVVYLKLKTNFGFEYASPITVKITNNTLPHMYIEGETYYGTQSITNIGELKSFKYGEDKTPTQKIYDANQNLVDKTKLNSSNNGTIYYYFESDLDIINSAKIIFKEENGLLTQTDKFEQGFSYHYSTADLKEVEYNYVKNEFKWDSGAGTGTIDSLFKKVNGVYEECSNQQLTYLYGTELKITGKTDGKNIGYTVSNTQYTGYKNTTDLQTYTLEGGLLKAYVQALFEKGGEKYSTLLECDKPNNKIKVSVETTGGTKYVLCAIKLNTQTFDAISLTQKFENPTKLNNVKRELVLEGSVKDLTSMVEYVKHEKVEATINNVVYKFNFNKESLGLGFETDGKNLFYSIKDENEQTIKMLVATICEYDSKTYLITHNLTNVPLPEDQDHLAFTIVAKVKEETINKENPALNEYTITDEANNHYKIANDACHLNIMLIETNKEGFDITQTNDNYLYYDSLTNALYRKVKYAGDGDFEGITIDASETIYNINNNVYEVINREDLAINCDYFIKVQSYTYTAYTSVYYYNNNYFNNSFNNETTENITSIISKETRYDSSLNSTTPKKNGNYFVEYFELVKFNVVNNEIHINGVKVSNEILNSKQIFKTQTGVVDGAGNKVPYTSVVDEYATDLVLEDGEYYFKDYTLKTNYVISRGDVILQFEQAE